MKLDLALVGGGLANGLIAERLMTLRPDVRFAIFEAGASLGGNHTWCFHETDVPARTLEWLRPLVTQEWKGHDVAFPQSTRTMNGSYFAIRSSDFARVLGERLGSRLEVRTPVRSFDATSVTVGEGRIEAGAVIDGRGFHSGQPLDASWGYQKFVGLDVRLVAPHGLTRPILMDATVEQLDGFRFVYALPWDERTVLVEDTRYSDTPTIDADSFKACLMSWMAARGWVVEHIERQEQAALPIPLLDMPSSFDVPTVGVAGGFFHATTGYSLPVAAATAELIAGLPTLNVTALTARLSHAARQHSSAMSFFRLLNRMLFRGLPADERVRIFESFYGHRQALIERFYSGHLSWTDKLAALRRGAPTVPLRRAATAAFSLR